MTAKTKTAIAEKLRHYKSKFPLIVEQALAFASTSNFAREVKNVFQVSIKLHDDI